jgi:P-type E1-E2 ATPase
VSLDMRSVRPVDLGTRYETTKASDAVKALKASLKPQATVCRDGHWQVVDGATLVPGDLVLLGSGAHIPADCRVRAPGPACLCSRCEKLRPTRDILS